MRPSVRRTPIEHERLKDEPVVLAVAATHPLADRQTVTLSELREETFALDVPGANPDYDTAVIDACRRSGFEPHTLASSVFHDAWEGAVHTEGCVGLTVRTVLHAAHREVRLLKLREPLTFPLDLVWRNTTTGTLRPALAAVLTTARDVRHAQGWG